jgi:hypothetical protein
MMEMHVAFLLQLLLNAWSIVEFWPSFCVLWSRLEEFIALLFPTSFFTM